MSAEPIVSTLSKEDPSLIDLVEECIADLPQFVSQLNSELESNDLEQAARTAHAIKGAGGSYGFEPVARAAEAVEHACRAADLEAAKRHLQDLEALLPRLKAKPE